MILQHITTAKNAPRICTEGLVPGKTRGICAKPSDQKEIARKCEVYLTNNADLIAVTQCGKDWIERQDAQIIYLSVPQDDVTPVRYMARGAPGLLSTYEYIRLGPIPSSAILCVQPLNYADALCRLERSEWAELLKEYLTE
jgi:hypothetical protein